MLMATCCEDDIVPHVLPFVKEHIKSPDWRYRDAAVMAFGKKWNTMTHLTCLMHMKSYSSDPCD